jgi:hypothetical protein
MKIIIIVLMLNLLSFAFLFSQPGNYIFPKLKCDYLGKKLPGLQPEIFAPGIISTGMMERDITITPDGKEIYYGLIYGRQVTIMVTKLKNGIWSEPEVASFASDANFFYFEPCLSNDGSKIYFLTTLTPKGKEPKPRWGYQNIWVADRQPDGSWGKPYDPDTVINGKDFQYYPSLTNAGTLYFTRQDAQTKKSGIFRSKLIDGKFTVVEKLPAIINKEGTTSYNAFIAPDESYLIVCIDGKPCEYNPGKANYFIFFRDKNDNWSEGIPFGPEINIKGSNAMSASVSPDGKILFFAAQKLNEKFTDSGKGTTLKDIIELMNSPQNGDYDIYWVSASVIEKLKNKK